jgi:RNA recognition motif-containing protein
MAGRSRGFALLQYATLAEAEAAIGAYDQSDIGGRQIQVCSTEALNSFRSNRCIHTYWHMQCRIDRGPGRELAKQPASPVMSTLVVGNISPVCTETLLASIFSGYGMVAETRIMMNRNGYSELWG